MEEAARNSGLGSRGGRVFILLFILLCGAAALPVDLMRVHTGSISILVFRSQYSTCAYIFVDQMDATRCNYL